MSEEARDWPFSASPCGVETMPQWDTLYVKTMLMDWPLNLYPGFLNFLIIATILADSSPVEIPLQNIHLFSNGTCFMYHHI
jgi:hypothetical protein